MHLDIDARWHHHWGMTDSKPEPAGNQGAQALALAVKARGLGINEAGKIVGAPSGYLSRLLSGKRSPNRKIAVAIHEHFGVLPGAWDQELPDADDETDELAPVVIEKAV